MHYEKNSIAVDVEIKEDDGVMTIKTVTKVKDKEVFPALNIENKNVMDKILDVIANQQQAILTTREFWRNKPPQERGVRMISVACHACGHQFRVEEPCCGEAQKQITCPSCGKPLLLKRNR